ncbi:MAG TPA: outer membrane protein assembly factor BamE [Gammaproteobacteria bacterium]|nr:outer membrane protein assembly factor BamE [Gammaproteobacteria bacterium]
MQKILISLALLAGLTACTAHRPDVQQGNVVTEEQLAQLQKGMDRRQVRFVLGTPLLQDPFHRDRWDYYYSYTEGRGEPEGYRVTVHFENEQVATVERHGEVPKDVRAAVRPSKMEPPSGGWFDWLF